MRTYPRFSRIVGGRMLNVKLDAQPELARTILCRKKTALYVSAPEGIEPPFRVEAEVTRTEDRERLELDFLPIQP